MQPMGDKFEMKRQCIFAKFIDLSKLRHRKPGNKF